MELWVRNQDKENLVKVELLEIEEREKDCAIVTMFQKNVARLGIYKTKERALEVLDEIQDILKPKVIINTYKVEQTQLCDGTEFIQPILDDIQVQSATTYVYEMPEK